MTLSIRRQQGASMTEMLLSLAVMTAFFAMAAPWLAQSYRDARAKNSAEQIQSFVGAASQYYIANEDAMLSAMADGTGASSHCMIKADTTTGTGGTLANDTTLHTCAFDVNWLIYKNMVPSSTKATNAYGQRLVAIFRRVYDSTNTATTNAEMITVGAYESSDTIGVPTYDELTATAEILGHNGGILPDQDRATCKAVRSTSTYEICGQGGGWKVDLSKFISASQLATFAAGLPN